MTKKSGSDLLNQIQEEKHSKMYTKRDMKNLQNEINKRPQKQEYYAIEYAGYWTIQKGANYDDPNILNAKDVGKELAKNNAQTIVNFLNSM